MTKEEKKPIVISFHTDMTDLNLKEVEKTFRKMSYPPLPKDQPIKIVLIYSKDEPVTKAAKSSRGGTNSGIDENDESD
jgi:hypothetical protein